jgi:hypothetical protein
VSKVWFNGVWFESLSDLVYAWKHDKDKLRSSWGFVIPGGDYVISCHHVSACWQLEVMRLLLVLAQPFFDLYALHQA